MAISKLQEMMAARRAQAAVTTPPVEVIKATQELVVAPELANFKPKEIVETFAGPITLEPLPAPVVAAKIHPLTMRMAELAEALTANIPNFPTILQDIHKHLRLDPAIVTLMTEDEIRLVVNGLERHAQVTVVAPKAVKDAKKMGKLNITADLL